MRQLGTLGQVLWKGRDLFLLCIELVHAEKVLVASHVYKHKGAGSGALAG